MTAYKKKINWRKLEIRVDIDQMFIPSYLIFQQGNRQINVINVIRKKIIGNVTPHAVCAVAIMTNESQRVKNSRTISVSDFFSVEQLPLMKHIIYNKIKNKQ